jgi:energy-coupling factor transporter transmembrane protein EcfT
VRLQNSWLTIATIALVSLLVFKFKSDGPWADSYKWALKLALAVILFRVFIGIVIGVPVPGSVLFTIPTIPLPDWMAGITLGGAVTWERVSSTIIESLNIASIIALFGAATALTNPRAVLRSIPPIFYEVGMVLVIATTLTPQLVGNLKRIRIAQKMRGISTNRFLSWRQIAMPLLEDSLARALDLAAAMDSRGYGQSRKRSKYRPQKFAFRDLLFLSTSLAFLAVSI